VRIEVLCTGDELLTGITADTNSPYFMDRVLRLGERVQRTTVVGDDRRAIAAALREIAARADVVLVSGGLGPTSDDLTVDAAADAAGVEVDVHGATLQRLRQRFEQRGLRFSENNARQARLPRGAEVVDNAVGSAPMFLLQLGGCRAVFVAGVPREYRHLVEHEVLPRLRAWRSAQPGAVAHAFRLLRTVGLPESHLDERVTPVRAAHPHVSFGFRTQAPENHLTLLARAPSEEDAERALAAAERDAAAAIGPFLYGRDDDSLAGVVLAALQARGETVGVAESCTGGLLSTLLTAVPGASATFVGGLVTYTSELKARWAQVPDALLREHGPVSSAVAERLAEGARDRARVTWGLGVTGWAGPGGGDAREPVGTVYLAVAGPGQTRCTRHVFGRDRERVRTFAAFAALDALRLRLSQEEGTG
jgi:nicotinamide-nucleotide amidase